MFHHQHLPPWYGGMFPDWNVPPSEGHRGDGVWRQLDGPVATAFFSPLDYKEIQRFCHFFRQLIFMCVRNSMLQVLFVFKTLSDSPSAMTATTVVSMIKRRKKSFIMCFFFYLLCSRLCCTRRSNELLFSPHTHKRARDRQVFTSSLWKTGEGKSELASEVDDAVCQRKHEATQNKFMFGENTGSPRKNM